ncbi:hypothetical protein BKA93DRAFT_778184 [Sparassis latifolia]
MSYHPTNEIVPVVTTPLAAKDPSSEQRDSEKFDRRNTTQRYVKHARAAKSFLIGPMPVREFLGFLPETDMSRMPLAVDAFKGIPTEAKQKCEIIAPIITALNGEDVENPRCPGFVFKDTTTRSFDCGKIGSLNPDICCYVQEFTDSVKPNPPPTGSLAHAELHIDVKRKPGLDFLSDAALDDDRSSHSFILNIEDETLRKRAELSLGKNVACAIEACARQHRTFYFSVSLAGSHARLIRWDRAGAIASESFNLHDNPKPLCEFLWRYAHASNSQRGCDSTVEPASPMEEALFKKTIEQHVKLQLNLRGGKALRTAVEEHYQPGVVAAINMVGKDAVVRRLLVSRPVVSPLYMTGRCTRGYWAVTTGGPTDEVVFLKDTWRYNVPRVKEGNILEDLSDAGVPHIPHLVYHSDVLVPVMTTKEESEDESENEDNDEETPGVYLNFQCTQSDRYQRAPWVCSGGRREVSLTPHVHYRLVVGTVGYGLDRFKGSEELLYATYDAYEAMMAAFNIEDPAKRRLHCDVSLGNIILVKDPNSDSTVRRGYLIDWEFSSLVTEAESSQSQHKTGTLQYMSQRLLQRKNVHHTFQDDMESIFYVVLYCSLRWLPHNRPPNELAETLWRFFENDWVNKDGIRMGGDGKISNMVTRCHTTDLHFPSPGIQSWLEEVMNFSADYALEKDTGFAEVWRNPASFAEFWRDFLDTHQLSADDRFNHRLPPARRPGVMMSYPLTSSASLNSRAVPSGNTTTSSQSYQLSDGATSNRQQPIPRAHHSGAMMSDASTSSASSSLHTPSSGITTTPPLKRKAGEEPINAHCRVTKRIVVMPAPRKYNTRSSTSLVSGLKRKVEGELVDPRRTKRKAKKGLADVQVREAKGRDGSVRALGTEIGSATRSTLTTHRRRAEGKRLGAAAGSSGSQRRQHNASSPKKGT